MVVLEMGQGMLVLVLMLEMGLDVDELGCWDIVVLNMEPAWVWR